MGILKINPWCFSYTTAFLDYFGGSPFHQLRAGEPQLGHPTEWLLGRTGIWELQFRARQGQKDDNNMEISWVIGVPPVTIHF